MLYPLSYECLCVFLCLLFLPDFSTRSALREQHYMTGGVRRNPFVAPGLTCGNDVKAGPAATPWSPGNDQGTGEAPVRGDWGFLIFRGGGGI